jgi:hypothetical protein
VKRFQSKGFEDKEIECALGQFKPFVCHVRSTLPLLHETIEHADVEVQGDNSVYSMAASTMDQLMFETSSSIERRVTTCS